MKLIYITLFALLLFSCKQTSLKEGTTTKESKIIETFNTSKDVIYNQLQGTWVNTQSPLSTLSFNNNTVVNSYDGVVVKKNIEFSLQDSLLLMTPKGNLRFSLSQLFDKNGHPIESALGSGHRVTIEVPHDELYDHVDDSTLNYCMLIKELPTS